MKLSQGDIRCLKSWKEGERFDGEPEPMLPKVAFRIVSHHAHKRKTARGKLKAAAQAIRLVLAVLEGGKL